MMIFGNQLFLLPILAASVATISMPPVRAGEIATVDPESAGFDGQQLAKIKATMQERIEEGQLVGGMGLVARGDKVVLAETWGMRDRENQEPMAHDTIFRIYSMTKPVTSVAAMMLVEQGKLELDAPISKYLPEMAHPKVLVETDDGTREVPAEREITVRDLMRHTSGLTYGFFGNTEVDERYKKEMVLVTDRTLEETIDKLAKIPLLYQPRTRWHYSVSTDVLGRVIEVASGQTLAEYFTEKIFRPLGMEDTYFTVPADKLDRLAQLYTPDGNGGLKPSSPMRSLRFVSPTNRYYSGGGGLCSTTADYLAFCRMLLGGGKLGETRLLSESSVAEMTKNQLGDLPGNRGGMQFGLGFSIDDRGTYGWGGAAGTRFRIDPQNNLITIYMVQISPTGKFDYADDVKRMVYAAMEE